VATFLVDFLRLALPAPLLRAFDLLALFANFPSPDIRKNTSIKNEERE
jgi:hypothetical protein